MSDIPEDVMKVARGCICAKETTPGKAPLTVHRIALAIIAERERSVAWHNLNKTIETMGRATAAEEVAIDRVLAKYPNLGSTMRTTTETKEA